LKSQRVVDEFVLDGGFELLEQLDKLVDFESITFDELLLVAHDGLFEGLVHTFRRLFDIEQQLLYEIFGLFDSIKRHFH
jgi:hypothetical protein